MLQLPTNRPDVSQTLLHGVWDSTGRISASCTLGAFWCHVSFSTSRSASLSQELRDSKARRRRVGFSSRVHRVGSPRNMGVCWLLQNRSHKSVLGGVTNRQGIQDLFGRLHSHLKSYACLGECVFSGRRVFKYSDTSDYTFTCKACIIQTPKW